MTNAKNTVSPLRTVTGMAELQAVIKGLKCGSCTTCPYFQIEFCSHAVKRDAIKLIESQQAEIERLTSANEELAKLNGMD